MSERTTTRKSVTMPNLRDKFERGKVNLSTKIQTGKEKISAGGKKLKLKVALMSILSFVPCHLSMF